MFTALRNGDNTKDMDDYYSNHIKDHYKVFSLVTPGSVSFCGEEVPMNLEDVQEKLDRELLVNTYWHSNTFLLFKRANRWFPVIEPILEKNQIPSDFKYLALIESGLSNATSSAGAKGFWQFMEKTAKGYGLRINDDVDERYHVEKSTEAACAYFKEAYAKFGSWALVAASYNMGMAGVDREMKSQFVDDYWDLQLNQETGRYVYRILAVKEIMNNSEQYGFVLRPKDLYAPYETYEIKVDTAISDLATFAIEQGVNYKVLKTINPWLSRRSLSPSSGEVYMLKLPKDCEGWLN